MKNLSIPWFTSKIEISQIYILCLMILFSFAMVLNNFADIAKVVLKSDIQLSVIKVLVLSLGFIILYFSSFVILPYKELTFLIKFLFVTTLIHLVAPLLVEQDWFSVLKSTFIPTLKFDKNFLLTLTAVFLTTISPYLFFKQASN